jgi:hypothetical protein
LSSADDDGAGEGKSSSSSSRLAEFPYYENYVELVRLELGALRTVMAVSPRRVVFVGCGALPVSSVCLREALEGRGGGLWDRDGDGDGDGDGDRGNGEGEVEVRNVDCDEEAVRLGGRLCERLGVEGVSFEVRRAGEEEGNVGEGGGCYAGVEVLVLAALVGETQREKENVLLVRCVAL